MRLPRYLVAVLKISCRTSHYKKNTVYDFRYPNELMFRPGQAKVIKRQFKYPGIKHLTGGVPQIDLLIDYAKQKKALAAYFFYNYIDDCDLIEKIENTTKLGIEFFGCTIANAHNLKREFFNIQTNMWTVPSFGALHTRYAVPFHSFICPLLYNEFNDVSIFKIMDSHPGYEIKYYSYKELQNDLFWKDLLPAAQIGFVNEENNFVGIEKQKTTENIQHFNPKYRIMFSKQFTRKGGLYRLS